MNTPHRYSLEKRKGRKHLCPSCGKAKFVRYLDNQSGEYLDDSVGKCERINNCGYHYPPKDFFSDNKDYQPAPFDPQRIKPTPPPRPASFHPPDLMEATLKLYHANNLVRYCGEVFGWDAVNRTLETYPIGTAKNPQNGSTIFWQIDIDGNIRGGHVIYYSNTGNRNKSFTPTWAHRILKIDDFELNQCLYNEHLLYDTAKPIALVEAPKTAFVCALVFPDFHWLATGGIQELKRSKVEVLKGRSVTLFPDLKAYDDWNKKAAELSDIAYFHTSTILMDIEAAAEVKATNDTDLADYLFQYKIDEVNEVNDANDDISKVLSEQNHELDGFTAANPLFEVLIDKLDLTIDAVKPLEVGSLSSLNSSTSSTLTIDWMDEVTELERLFSSATIPSEPIHLDTCTTITNPHLFIQNHLDTIKANNGKRTFEPYLERIKEIQKLLMKIVII